MNVEMILDALVTAGLGGDPNGARIDTCRLKRLTTEAWEQIWEAAALHQIWSVVWAGARAYGLEPFVPGTVRQRFEGAERTVAYQYYNMLSFTTYVTELLRDAGIRFYLLKGIALNMFYPDEAMRKLADADIYIPDQEECGKADRLLREKGFSPEKGNENFHRGYVKPFFGRTRLLELHWRPCDILPDAEAEKAVAGIYGTLPYRPDMIPVACTEIPVLPAPENALQLLLHMFQHFVREGFGLRMICDWKVYWEYTGKACDSGRFEKYLEQTGLTGFAWSVTRICMTHFSLGEDRVPWISKIDGSRYEDSAECLYADILAGGEFGKGEKARVILLDGNLFSPVSYVRAVHRMMRARYPRAGRIIPAWPVLWGLTVLIFLRNNKRMNRGKTSDVIKSAGQRSLLMKKMDIFAKKGRKKK